MEQVIAFFKEENIDAKQFFEYIKNKVHILPYDASIDLFGCFPILKEDIIVDIRLLVPEIITKENLLVNIHEFYHAYELYCELGTVYIENREERERNAISFETKYLLKK